MTRSDQVNCGIVTIVDPCRIVRGFAFVAMSCFTLSGFSQDMQCRQLQLLEQDVLNNLPVVVDDVTSLVGLNVNCGKREIQFVKHLSIPAAELEAGIKHRKQRQYLAIHCNSDGFATRGWSTVDYIYDKNLSLIMSLRASPSMCP